MCLSCAFSLSLHSIQATVGRASIWRTLCTPYQSCVGPPVLVGTDIFFLWPHLSGPQDWSQVTDLLGLSHLSVHTTTGVLARQVLGTQIVQEHTDLGYCDLTFGPEKLSSDQPKHKVSVCIVFLFPGATEA